jgi:hypothetical protein
MKAHSKPKRNPQIAFDREMIRIDGFERDGDPVVQAKSASELAARLLSENTGRRFDVRSVVRLSGLLGE